MRARILGKLAVTVLFAASLSLPAYVSAEELAPGFDACMRKANDASDVRWARRDCYDAAKRYWNDILQNNYKEAKQRAVQQGCDPEHLLKFRWAFDQYIRAGMPYSEECEFFVEETKKMARLMTTLYR